MTTDIYTGRAIALPSAEHVIPSALGGRLKDRGLIDKSTNDRFGSTIDAALNAALQPFRVLVDGRSDRGRRSPPPLRSIPADDGASYDIEAGGIAHPGGGPPKIILRDGGFELSGCRTDRDAERCLRSFAAKHGYAPDHLVSQIESGKVTHTSPSPTFSFPCSVYQTECYRAIAKVAANFLAIVEPDFFRSSACAEVRQFVSNPIEGRPPPVEPVVLSSDDEAIGPVDHLVVLGSSGENVVALVTFFGALSFVVMLAKGTCRDVAACYRVNQVTLGDLRPCVRRDDPRDLNATIPSFDDAAARSYEQFATAALTNFQRTLTAALDVQRHLHLGRVVAHACRTFEPDQSLGLMGADSAQEFAHHVASAVVEDLRPQIEQAMMTRRDAAWREFVNSLAKAHIRTSSASEGD